MSRWENNLERIYIFAEVRKELNRNEVFETKEDYNL